MFNTELKKELEEVTNSRNQYRKELADINELHERRFQSERTNNEIRIKKLESDNRIALNEITLDKDREHFDEMVKLNAELHTLRGENKAKDLVIAAKDDTVTKLQEQLEFLATKIPTVDLAKLQFTVTNNQTIE